MALGSGYPFFHGKVKRTANRFEVFHAGYEVLGREILNYVLAGEP
jgi:hypothetical protein